MSKPKKSYGLFVAGRILRSLFVLLICVISAALFWRVFLSGRLPKEMRRVAPNEVLHASAGADGSLSAFTQKQSTATRGVNNYGYFSVPRFVILPEARQVQVVFRYNNSTLRATKEDFQLDAVPEKGAEVYDVSLLLLRDLTPENKEDNQDGSDTLEKVRIAPTSKAVATTGLYTYFLYTFDGVTLENVPVIYFDIYFPNGEPVDYSKDPYGTLRIYHEESERIAVSLSSAEKKAIADFAP